MSNKIGTFNWDRGTRGPRCQGSDMHLSRVSAQGSHLTCTSPQRVQGAHSTCASPERVLKECTQTAPLQSECSRSALKLHLSRACAWWALIPELVLKERTQPAPLQSECSRSALNSRASAQGAHSTFTSPERVLKDYTRPAHLLSKCTRSALNLHLSRATAQGALNLHLSRASALDIHLSRASPQANCTSPERELKERTKPKPLQSECTRSALNSRCSGWKTPYRRRGRTKTADVGYKVFAEAENESSW